MKRLTLCLALVLPLALAGAAEAKNVISAKVCGASDCRTVEDRDALAALSEGGGPTEPPTASPFYQVDLTGRGDGERFTFTVVIVPEAGLLRGGTEAEGYTWMPVSPKAVGEFRRMTRGLEPFPAAKLGGLEPPEARVDEVVLPPAEPDSGGGGAPVWSWIVFAVGTLALAALAAGRLRRPRPSPGSPEPAEG